MQTNDKQYYIYIRSTKERIPCTKEEFDAYYHDITIFRQREQYHGRCVCPKKRFLFCDMDCQTCPFHRFEATSMDAPIEFQDGSVRTLHDEIEDPQATIDDNFELRQALHSLLAELTPDEKDICLTIMDDLAERVAAASLNLPRNTYVYRRDKLLKRLKNNLEKFL